MRVIAIPEKDWTKADAYLLHQGAWWGRCSVDIRAPGYYIIEVEDDKHAAYILMKFRAYDITSYKDDFVEREVSSTTLYIGM